MKSKLLTFSTIVLLVAAGLSAKAQNWLITGNTNIIGNGTNFLGTRNSQPIIFKTNNVERMRIRGSGQVGIGIDQPAYCLQIQNPTYQRGIYVNNNFVGNQDRIGLYTSSINNPGWGFGLQAWGGFYGAQCIGSGGNYAGGVIGVYGSATGSGSNGSRYGVYGSASGGSFTAAGYFDGDVWASSYNLLSDRKVKTNISPLQNSLVQLMKLKPTAYEFNATQHPNMGLPKGKQIGLIADEVKQVFPELVRTAVHPAQYNADKTVLLHPEEKYEGINYIGLIPVMIASIQEQQKTMDAVKSENEAIRAENKELKLRLANIEQMLATGKQISTPVSLTDAQLEQNAPNPFNRNTTINYYLPQKSSSAVVNITDMNGKVVKTVTLTNQGKGQLLLEAGQLTPGTYQYSLIVNGKLADSKKMVLTK